MGYVIKLCTIIMTLYYCSDFCDVLIKQVSYHLLSYIVGFFVVVVVFVCEGYTILLVLSCVP